MKINPKNDQPILLENKPIDTVDSFNYLGNIEDVLGGTETDIQDRIHKARHAFSSLNKLWNTEQIDLSTKLRIYKSNVLAVLLYGSETWFFTKTLEKKIQTFVNRCLRRIKKIFWPHVIRNEDLWAQTNCPQISPQIKSRKWRWMGHTLRKNDNEISKVSLQWNPQGKRRRGRPKKTWRR